MTAWELLSDLEQKQRLHHEFPSGDFEFSFEESSVLNSFFPKDKAAKSLEFRPFGRDASGTIFALWNRTADLTIPVVGFGSEGERRVLSATLDDFLALLLVGYESILLSDPFKTPALTMPVAAWFQKALAERNIKAPQTGAQIFSQASRLQRDFLAACFDVTLVFAQGYQLYVSNLSCPGPAPTLITEQDLQARVKRFESGLAFYVDDRDNLDVEVSLDVISPLEAPSRLREFAPAYAAHTEFFEVGADRVFVWGVCDEPRAFQKLIPPGRYQVRFFHFTPTEHRPLSPQVLQLDFYSQTPS